MNDELIVLHEDMAAVGFCNHHARPWAVQHGFDWTDFIRNGIPAGRLIATGDAMALRVVEAARRRIEAR
jgi:hypothetical protein